MMKLKKEIDFYENYDLENLIKKNLLDDIDLAMGLARHNIKFREHALSREREILELNNGKVGAELVYHCRRAGDYGKNKTLQKMILEGLDKMTIGGISGSRGRKGHREIEF